MSAQEPRLVRAVLMASRLLSPRVRSLALQSQGPEPLDWLPGQYLEVGLPDDAAKRTPLSVASAPDPERPGYFELAVSRGTGGGLLDELPIGATLEVFGPLGRLVAPPGDDADLFVGAGTGLAPLRAILQAAVRAGGSAPLCVLFGCRNESEILWGDELSALAAREPRVRFEPVLSRPSDGWTGRRGWVQEHIAELLAPLHSPRVYLCGVRDMIDAAILLLEGELGVPRERILTEIH